MVLPDHKCEIGYDGGQTYIAMGILLFHNGMGEDIWK